MTGFTVTGTASGFSGQVTALKVIVATGVTEDGGAAAGQVAFGTPSVSLTPAGNGSLIVWGLYNGSDATLFTAATGNTLLDNTAGTGGAPSAWADGWYSGSVVAGTPVTAGASGPNAEWTGSGAVELPASGTPALDASAPAAVQATSGTVTTAAFTPPGGSVLAALLMFQSSDPGNATAGVTDTSGLGMSWTQRGLWESGYEAGVAVFTATVPDVFANDPGALAGGCVI